MLPLGFRVVQTAQILTTLLGHKAFVNCTLWLPINKFAFKGKIATYKFAFKVQCSESLFKLIALPSSTAKGYQHYLLSGVAGGAIILWEYSVPEGKGLGTKFNGTKFLCQPSLMFRINVQANSFNFINS
ncbi:hypothetical protein RchiOBHm_Chr7g0200531 [Rosa chinensis]|uniref:Uncharacterized protein n=1 Tax=Rosa chinensis TaxID=74649 RepID=A0A2P6P7P7_ROSCH|nr:hypothetical protein RchiOBHm_Chr7g0200531 [Rosa chinensis]